MKFLVIFALALATASAFETAVPLKDLAIDVLAEGRITNGQPSANGQFPYQTSLLLIRANGGYVCGGSIISANCVLTAAHCTNEVTSGTVYYGSIIRTGGQKAAFTRDSIIQHALYNPSTLANDVSIIKVPINLGDVVGTIKLPARGSSYTYAGDYALISGYGLTADTGYVSETQNFARSQIITNAECAAIYGTATVNDGTICISTPNGISTCNGDSGGPLTLENSKELAGVTSFVASLGCSKGYPAGFARVTFFRDWIFNNCGI